MNETDKSIQSNGDKLHAQLQRNIGSLIFQERQKRGIRQASLAARLDLNQEQIDMLEVGRGKIQWSVVYRILDYLHCKLELTLEPDGIIHDTAETPAEQQA